MEVALSGSGSGRSLMLDRAAGRWSRRVSVGGASGWRSDVVRRMERALLDREGRGESCRREQGDECRDPPALIEVAFYASSGHLVNSVE